jgi:hypothetical protein
MLSIDFPITESSPVPGPQHRNIAQAVAASGEDGTRSILDIESTDDEPDFGVAGSLSPEVLQLLYGTTRPNIAVVEDNLSFLKDVEPGQAVYVVCYDHGSPSHLVFAGNSYEEQC